MNLYKLADLHFFTTAKSMETPSEREGKGENRRLINKRIPVTSEVSLALISALAAQGERLCGVQGEPGC